jgi:hypothetical protein
MTPSPKRRWFRWSLRTMFVVVTVFGCWLGWEFHFFRERQELRRWMDNGLHGGSITPEFVERRGARLARPVTIPIWRKWLGDEPVAVLFPPEGATPAQCERVVTYFPEATIINAPWDERAHQKGRERPLVDRSQED